MIKGFSRVPYGPLNGVSNYFMGVKWIFRFMGAKWIFRFMVFFGFMVISCMIIGCCLVRLFQSCFKPVYLILAI